MRDDQKKKCALIIHAAGASAGAIAGGLAQLPGSDSIPLMKIQTLMVIAIAREFGVEMDRASAAATLSTLAATAVGRGLSQIFVGWIPGFGNAINGATALAITEAIGWKAASAFSQQDKLT